MLTYRFGVVAMLALVNLLFSQSGLGVEMAQAQTAPSAGSEAKPKLVDLWQPGDAGQRMNIRGRVTSLDGTPLAGIGITIRQADGTGEYSERYSTTLLTDDKGRYQFGSVLPGNYLGIRHVHIGVFHSDYRYYDSRILFKGDPNLDGLSEDDNAVFLEEATVNGETILFGNFDIRLVPR